MCWLLAAPDFDSSLAKLALMTVGWDKTHNDLKVVGRDEEISGLMQDNEGVFRSVDGFR